MVGLYTSNRIRKVFVYAAALWFFNQKDLLQLALPRKSNSPNTKRRNTAKTATRLQSARSNVIAMNVCFCFQYIAPEGFKPQNSAKYCNNDVGEIEARPKENADIYPKMLGIRNLTILMSWKKHETFFLYSSAKIIIFRYDRFLTFILLTVSFLSKIC